MAEQNPCIFLQAGSHPAEDVRRYISALVEDQEGILYDADLAVTQNGTPNMTVNVAAGRCFILGDSATFQGVYFCEARTTTNLAVATADATNPRWDIVVAEVLDAAYTGALNQWRLRVITGTPAASPAEPALPVSAIKLCRITVAAGDTAINTADITDTRTRWDDWRKPREAAATANPTSTSATPADITGATITFSTPRPNVRVSVVATFDMECTDGTTIGTGNLDVDGTDQAAVVVCEGAERKTLHQNWVVTLASSGSHTLKLQFARASGAGTVNITSVHTKLSIVGYW